MKDQSDTQTVELFSESAPKRRGRPVTGRARTGAQRQADLRYRRAHGLDGKYERKIDMYIESSQRSGLTRLASYYGKTERELLEQFIKQAEDDILKRFDFEAPEWDMYFNKTLRVTENKG